MADDMAFIGAYRDNFGDVWWFTNDKEKLLKQAKKNAVFGEIKEEIVAAFRDSAVNHPALSHHVEAGTNYVKAFYTYTGEDMEEVAAILAQHPAITYVKAAYSFVNLVRNEGTTYGLLVTNNGIRYSPADALRKFRKEKAKTNAPPVVGKDYIDRVVRGLMWDVCRVVQVDTCSGDTWFNTQRRLRRAVAVYNLFFGKDAHRRHEKFRDMLSKWVKMNEAQKRALTRTYQVHSLVAWLDEEAKLAKSRGKQKQKPVVGLKYPY